MTAYGPAEHAADLQVILEARASMGSDLTALTAKHDLLGLAEELDLIGKRAGGLPPLVHDAAVALRVWLEDQHGLTTDSRPGLPRGGHGCLDCARGYLLGYKHGLVRAQRELQQTAAQLARRGSGR